MNEAASVLMDLIVFVEESDEKDYMKADLIRIISEFYQERN